jgi:hypothetical protein
MASSSLGYVAVPRSPVIFDGTNYADFVAFMPIDMRGLRLRGFFVASVSLNLDFLYLHIHFVCI